MPMAADLSSPLRAPPVPTDQLSNISLYLSVVDEDPLTLFEELAALAREG